MCNVIEDRKITPEEVIQLQFEVAKLSIHTKNTNLENISEAVGKIGDIVLSPQGNSNVVTETNESSKESSPMINDLLENLLRIVDCFRNELYSDMEQFGSNGSETRDKIISAFSNYSNFLISKETTKNLETTGDKKDLKGWKKDTSNNTEIKYTKDNGLFSVGVAWEDDKWYFWFKTDEQDDARNIYQHLKSRFGGRFSQYSCWWDYLKEEYVSIPQSEFMTQLKNDSKLDAYIDNVLLNLCAYADNLQKLYNEVYHHDLNTSEITKNQGYTWFWYDRTLVIDFEGKDTNPFIDIILNEDNNKDTPYSITLGRRNSKEIELTQSDIVNQIKFKDKDKDGRYRKDNLSADEVVKYANIIIKNIHEIVIDF